MAKKTKAPGANFVVGRPWYPESKTDTAICVYGSQVHYGTMESAINFKLFVERQQQFSGDKRKYKIYQLVEVPGSEDFTEDTI